jgi:hypothetical protein
MYLPIKHHLPYKHADAILLWRLRIELFECSSQNQSLFMAQLGENHCFSSIFVIYNVYYNLKNIYICVFLIT